MGFFSRLAARCQEVDSLLCVGLDPHPADLKENTPQAAREFCLRLVEATAAQTAAFKPNSAFFEAFGPPGLAVLQEVIGSIPGEIPVILDAKRGDIASTAQAYARAAFAAFGAGALTASPYLGHDSLEPLLEDPDHGVFLLCKTSNPGAGDLQDLLLADQPGVAPGEMVYELVARRAVQWNVHDNLGLVVAATYPQALQRVRRIAPDLWILAPGVGAQGGDLQAALQAGLRADGLGMLLPVSRQISRAAHPAVAARELKDLINRQRFALKPGLQPHETPSSETDAERLQLALGLLNAGCVRFGSFTLKSGLQSPIYVDLRQLVGYPALLAQVARAYRLLLAGLEFDRIAALPYAALPIGTAISLQTGLPLIYPRKETKEYGTKADVEGVFSAGERAVVVDDLTTTGGSKFEAIDKLKACRPGCPGCGRVDRPPVRRCRSPASGRIPVACGLYPLPTPRPLGSGG